MPATSADVETELAELAAEVRHLESALGRFRGTSPSGRSQEAWEAGHICASATEKIYGGFERIMVRIVTDVDRVPIGRADGWHRSLLQRVAQPFPGTRGPVISRDCYDRLDRLRSFRHRERNSYGLDLDLGIVLARSAEAVAAYAAFRDEVTVFLKASGSD